MKAILSLIVLALPAVSLAQTTSVVIRVDATQVVRTIPRTLFGANVEWIWNGNTIYDPATGVNRPEIVSKTQALSPGILRFPGGALADDYYWRDGIGAQASRPERFHYIDGNYSTNTFGTHEFMKLCQATGAAPLLQVNVVSGTANEAANWVSYVNDPVHPERAANGSAAPFGVKYWEIGNEQYLNGTGSSTPGSFMTVADYAAKLNNYATAMKAVDPTIRIGAVSAKNFGGYQFLEDPDWNKKLLQAAGNNIDFLALHNGYAPIIMDPATVAFEDVYRAMFAFPILVDQNIKAIEAEIQTYAPAKASTMTLAITEWGPLFHYDPNSPWVDHAKTQGSGVFAATMLRTFLLSPRVESSAFFKLVEPSFMGMMFWDGVPKPTYYVQKMFANNFGTKVVKSEVTSPVYTSKKIGIVTPVLKVPYVDAISSLSPDGSKLYVIVINKHLRSSYSTSLQFTGFDYQPSVRKTVLSAPAADAHNGPDLLQFPGLLWATQITAPYLSQWNLGHPNAVVPKVTTVNAATPAIMSFPPVSVTALEFTRR